MTWRGKWSLRTKFLLSLTIGAVAMTFLGAFATYRIASEQLDAQLVQRGRLLASVINHSAMIADNESEFTHVASEVMHDNPEITGIIILAADGERTMFEEFFGSASSIATDIRTPESGSPPGGKNSVFWASRR